MKLANKGMSIIEVLVAMGMVTLGVVMFMNGADTYRISRAKIDSFRGVQNFQTEILGQLNSAPAWSQTIKQFSNTSLSCLRSSSDCYGQGGSFVVYDQAGEVFFNPVIHGINESGAKCELAGTAACPYRVNVTWNPICSGPSCYKPAVRFQSKIVQASGGPNATGSSEVVTNSEATAKFKQKVQGAVMDSKFIQSFGGNSLHASCLAFSGIYDGLTGECALPLNGDCPNSPVQQVVVGVTATMQKICKPMYSNASCNPDQYFAGLKSDGSANCKDKACCVELKCNGMNLYKVLADCGQQPIQANSPTCGYVAPPLPAAATNLLNQASSVYGNPSVSNNPSFSASAPPVFIPAPPPPLSAQPPPLEDAGCAGSGGSASCQ